MVRLFGAIMLFGVLALGVNAQEWSPPPKGQDAYETMRHLYGELLRFKSDPVFLKDQWTAGTPYASFKMMVDGMDKDQAAVMAMMKECNERDVSGAFCMPSDLARLGSAYYQAKGKENDETNQWRTKFDKMLDVDSDKILRKAAGSTRKKPQPKKKAAAR
jgi:hypothetical protein